MAPSHPQVLTRIPHSLSPLSSSSLQGLPAHTLLLSCQPENSTPVCPSHLPWAVLSACPCTCPGALFLQSLGPHPQHVQHDTLKVTAPPPPPCNGTCSLSSPASQALSRAVSLPPFTSPSTAPFRALSPSPGLQPSLSPSPEDHSPCLRPSALRPHRTVVFAVLGKVPAETIQPKSEDCETWIPGEWDPREELHMGLRTDPVPGSGRKPSLVLELQASSNTLKPGESFQVGEPA